MVLLCLARVLIALVPLRRWRGSLGLAKACNADAARDAQLVRTLAGHVERGASRLPFSTRCLPRAMALSWMLRLAGVPHAVIFSVRPQSLRDGADDTLHARLEAGGACVLGDLPGPWIDVARLGAVD